MTNRIKRYVIDALGIFLILIAIPIGWLPGPGGIPLIIIGLTLLAKNNKWAQEVLDGFEEKFKQFSEEYIYGNNFVMNTIDIAAAFALAGGLYGSFNYTGWLQNTSIWMAASSVIIFSLNRRRFARVWRRLKSQG